ncbi:MAG TPA: MBL fold metallo-hydrolase [Hyphomicrobiaceae bacterium]|jgi:glyoxylase-like metal-dependent hydrolase (beta-lactamase superfamily II)|nr:MBL fold metallo-hydrolase [Hyphomicrobiaceae bacterium]
MHIVSRRAVIAGAGAVTATAALGRTPAAEAAAPMIGKQAPGFYRIKLGDFEITQVSDGAATIPMPDGWVRNITKDQAQAALASAYMPDGKLNVPFNPIVINTGPKLVLIDAGYGPNIGPSVGLLPVHLAAAGIDPKTIDTVVLSHLHPDHINGVKTKDDTLLFPNAEHMVPAQDWAFWMSEENAAKAESQMMKNYFAQARKILGNMADKVTRYEWGKEVAPGITALDTSGHTPGHTSFAVASGNARMFVQSDVTNIPEFFLRNPDWHVVFDIDPAKAVQTRRRFYDMVAAEKALVAGFHFAFPSQGYVEKDGTGYRLVPVRWNPVL